MTNKLDLYQCEICKKMVQILIEGEGELVCCNKPMKKVIANTEENVNLEYHLPVNIQCDNEEYIQVGKETHPMTEEHHIEFIQVISECGKKIFTHILEPSSEPKIKIEFDDFGNYKMIEFCNLHGLWENGKK